MRRWFLIVAALYALGIAATLGLAIRFPWADAAQFLVGLTVLQIVSQIAVVAVAAPWRRAERLNQPRLAATAICTGFLPAVPTAEILLIGIGTVLEHRSGSVPNLSFWPALLWCWGGWALLFWFICLGKDSLAVLRGCLSGSARSARRSCSWGGSSFRGLRQAVSWRRLVPLWGDFLCACFASWSLALLAIYGWYRTCWRRGNCPACDYDLRGLSEMRCPECGTPVHHGGDWNIAVRGSRRVIGGTHPTELHGQASLPVAPDPRHRGCRDRSHGTQSSR